LIRDMEHQIQMA